MWISAFQLGLLNCRRSALEGDARLLDHRSGINSGPISVPGNHFRTGSFVAGHFQGRNCTLLRIRGDGPYSATNETEETNRQDQVSFTHYRDLLQFILLYAPSQREATALANYYFRIPKRCTKSTISTPSTNDIPCSSARRRASSEVTGGCSQNVLPPTTLAPVEIIFFNSSAGR